MRVDSEDGRFSTCNVLYPRALLEEMGGFDSGIDMYGEDTDLGQRALQAGATSSFAPDALVDHAVHRLTLRTAIRDRLRLREMPQLVRRHPHLRYATCSGHFVRESHRSLLFGLAGLGVLPLGRFGLRSSRRWIDDATERVPRELRHGRRLSQQVMLLAALDAVEVVACARGSVKSRTLLL
jgi:GT2 family glycosyltransferase